MAGQKFFLALTVGEHLGPGHDTYEQALKEAVVRSKDTGKSCYIAVVLAQTSREVRTTKMKE